MASAGDDYSSGGPSCNSRCNLLLPRGIDGSFYTPLYNRYPRTSALFVCVCFMYPGLFADMRISRFGGRAIPGKGIEITPHQPARAISGAVDHRSCSIVTPERVWFSNPRSDLARALSHNNADRQSLSLALDPCLRSTAKPAAGICWHGSRAGQEPACFHPGPTDRRGHRDTAECRRGRKDLLQGDQGLHCQEQGAKGPR